MLKHLDLFSGIGGFSLACQWVGIETICFVEIDKYCQKVLKKHWSDVPIVEDIRDVQKIKEIVENARCKLQSGCEVEAIGNKETGRRVASLNQRPSGTPRDLLQSNTGAESPTILITAGFPCQPFSVAGKRQGERDDRYLWPQTLEVIKAIKPKWVLLENVAGIINLALDQVLSDLESAGYTTETLIIPACAINALHRRDRVWIIAYCNKYGESIMPINGGKGQGKLGIIAYSTDSGSEEVSIADTHYPKTTRQRGYGRQVYGVTESEGLNICSGKDWWAVEPELGRVAHGIPNRVDRLKCLGNAIVPQVAFQLIKTIIKVENSNETVSNSIL